MIMHYIKHNKFTIRYNKTNFSETTKYTLNNDGDW